MVADFRKLCIDIFGSNDENGTRNIYPGQHHRVCNRQMR